jgi:hypothetical protein
MCEAGMAGVCAAISRRRTLKPMSTRSRAARSARIQRIKLVHSAIGSGVAEARRGRRNHWSNPGRVVRSGGAPIGWRTVAWRRRSLRGRGVLFARRFTSRRAKAQALVVARHASPAHLLRDHGNRAEARKRLARVYAWFKERFDKADFGAGEGTAGRAGLRVRQEFLLDDFRSFVSPYSRWATGVNYMKEVLGIILHLGGTPCSCENIRRQLTCYRYIFFATLRFQIDARILFGTTVKKVRQRFSAIPDSLPQSAPRAPDVALVRTFNTVRFHRADEDGAQMSSRFCSSADLTQEGNDPCQT